MVLLQWTGVAAGRCAGPVRVHAGDRTEPEASSDELGGALLADNGAAGGKASKEKAARAIAAAQAALCDYAGLGAK